MSAAETSANMTELSPANRWGGILPRGDRPAPCPIAGSQGLQANASRAVGCLFENLSRGLAAFRHLRGPSCRPSLTLGAGFCDLLKTSAFGAGAGLPWLPPHRPDPPPGPQSGCRPLRGCGRQPMSVGPVHSPCRCSAESPGAMPAEHACHLRRGEKIDGQGPVLAASTRARR